MTALLASNPLLLLFVTAALGYAVGRIRVKGASLGVAAVLFVGLAIGSFHPGLAIPDFAFTFGLAVFVYTIGLSSGAGFFASFSRKGLRDNLFVLAVLVVAAGLVVGAALLFDLKATVASGLFAGSLTNTPALAGVLETIRDQTSDAAGSVLDEPVVGYSVAYPMGVLGPILAISAVRALFRIDYRREAARLRDLHLVQESIATVTVRVANPAVIGRTVRELHRDHSPGVVLTRIRHGGRLRVADRDARLDEGDLVTVVGRPEDVERAGDLLGEVDPSAHLELDRTTFDFRRVFVSRGSLVGRRIRDLELPERYGAVVTRVRHGDVDFMASGDTVLELGDRVRVVAPRERMKEVSQYFGDSYRMLSEVDLLSLGLGLSLGLLVGLVPIPLPGGVTFELGSAGGPLLVGLVLGAVRRTGPIVWTISYSANLTLRQIGLILFLATVGLKSGYTFVSTFTGSGGVTILLVGAAISVLVPFGVLVVGYRVLHVPYGMLTGMVSAVHTQPAVLGYAAEHAGDESPTIGWSLAYPISMITKIILAQVIFTVLGGVP